MVSPRLTTIRFGWIAAANEVIEGTGAAVLWSILMAPNCTRSARPHVAAPALAHTLAVAPHAP